MKKYILLVTVLAFTNIALAQNKNNSLIKSSVAEITVQKDSIKKNLKKVITTSQTQVTDVLKSSTTEVNKILSTPQTQVTDVLKSSTTEVNKILTAPQTQVIDLLKSPTTQVNKILSTPQTQVTNLVTNKVLSFGDKIKKPFAPILKISKKIEKIAQKISNKSVFSLDLGLGFSGGTISAVQVVPAMGLRINKYYTVGLGLPSRYTTVSIDNVPSPNREFFAGLRVYHRLNLPFGGYLQLENEFLKQVSGLGESKLTPAAWLGGGYNLPIADKYGISILALYNPLYKDGSFLYTFPVDIRVGFNLDKTVQTFFDKKTPKL